MKRTNKLEQKLKKLASDINKSRSKDEWYLRTRNNHIRDAVKLLRGETFESRPFIDQSLGALLALIHRSSTQKVYLKFKNKEHAIAEYNRHKKVYERLGLSSGLRLGPDKSRLQTKLNALYDKIKFINSTYCVQEFVDDICRVNLDNKTKYSTGLLNIEQIIETSKIKGLDVVGVCDRFLDLASEDCINDPEKFMHYVNTVQSLSRTERENVLVLAGVEINANTLAAMKNNFPYSELSKLDYVLLSHLNDSENFEMNADKLATTIFIKNYVFNVVREHAMSIAQSTSNQNLNVVIPNNIEDLVEKGVLIETPDSVFNPRFDESMVYASLKQIRSQLTVFTVNDLVNIRANLGKYVGVKIGNLEHFSGKDVISLAENGVFILISPDDLDKKFFANYVKLFVKHGGKIAVGYDQGLIADDYGNIEQVFKFIKENNLEKNMVTSYKSRNRQPIVFNQSLRSVEKGLLECYKTVLNEYYFYGQSNNDITYCLEGALQDDESVFCLEYDRNGDHALTIQAVKNGKKDLVKVVLSDLIKKELQSTSRDLAVYNLKKLFGFSINKNAENLYDEVLERAMQTYNKLKKQAGDKFEEILAGTLNTVLSYTMNKHKRVDDVIYSINKNLVKELFSYCSIYGIN